MNVEGGNKDTVFSLYSDGACDLSSLNQSSSRAGLKVARDRRFISVCVTHRHDGGSGEMSGQVGSEQGLTTLLHKNGIERFNWIFSSSMKQTGCSLNAKGLKTCTTNEENSINV